MLAMLHWLARNGQADRHREAGAHGDGLRGAIRNGPQGRRRAHASSHDGWPQPETACTDWIS